MFAETAYIFRHALMRDAAYELQPPRERSRLHELALTILQQVLADDELDHVAVELAEHARHAIHDDATDEERSRLLMNEHAYLLRAARYLKAHWESEAELRVLDRLARHEMSDRAEQRRHLFERIQRLFQLGDIPAAERTARRMLEHARADNDRDDETRACLMLVEASRDQADAALPEPLAKLVERTSHLEPYSRLFALKLRAGELNRQRQPEQAQEMYQRALDLAREAEMFDWVASLKADLARDRIHANDSEGALALSREAINLIEEHGDKHLVAQLRNQHGITLIDTGDLQGASEAYRSARELAGEIGARGLEVTISTNLANLMLYFLGRLKEAEREYRRALECAIEIGATADAAEVAQRLGVLCTYLGEEEEALELFALSADYARRAGHLALAARNIASMANCGKALEPADRLARIIEAVTLAREAGSQRVEGEAWMFLANMLVEQGLLHAGVECAEHAEAVLENTPMGRGFIPHLRALRGRVHLLMGEPEHARELAREFLETSGRSSPHHLAVKGFAPLIGAALLESAGPWGTGEVPADTRERILELRETMHESLKDSEYRHHGDTCKALQFADDVAAALEQGPPYPFYFGATPESLTGQQIQATLDRIHDQKPDALEELQEKNPELRSTLNRDATSTWLQWDTSLSDLPGVPELLP